MRLTPVEGGILALPFPARMEAAKAYSRVNAERGPLIAAAVAVELADAMGRPYNVRTLPDEVLEILARDLPEETCAQIAAMTEEELEAIVSQGRGL